MRKSQLANWLFCFCMSAGMLSCADKNVETGSLHVIPQPQEIVEAPDDDPFVINSSTVVCYPQDNTKMEHTAHFLASYIKEMTGTEVKVSVDKPKKNYISLELDAENPHKEGYDLDITSDRVVLKGATEAGVFYGTQTIHKALPVTDGKTQAALPAGKVKDYPTYGYRGFMIDVGRHFFSVDYLKEMIDVMALHNINTFHWHLTEDQGWRIEIKKYPKLTEVGAYRKGTLVNYETQEYDSIPVSGYYTQEEAREIIRYAADRFITVIPEIDMPGHMMAALAAYPELGCTGGPYEIPMNFGVFKEVLCGGNEQTLQFAKDVLNEIMNIFPSEYIHIGGDECPKERWRECPKCQAKIRELGLQATPEHSKENQLQAYFMAEVEKEINARGRKVLAWDEILDGDPTKTTVITAWTSPKAAVKSARLGHQTIVCPITNLYFSNPSYNRLKGVASVARVYNFNPSSDELTVDEKKNIIGVQGCIWTEWTKDSLKMEWQMMPRIAALAELQWSAPEKKELSGFLKRLPHQLDLYTRHGYHYKQDIYDVNIDMKRSESELGKAEVTFTTFDDAPVYYTTDGSEPTSSSTCVKLSERISVPDSVTIRAKAIRDGKESETTECRLKK